MKSKYLIIASFFTMFYVNVKAQIGQWTTAKEENFSKSDLMSRKNTPTKYDLLQTDFNFLQESLKNAPLEENATSIEEGLLMNLPGISGKAEAFYVFNSPSMESELAAKFPEIGSYKAINKKDPSNVIHISISPYFGMHIMGYNNEGQTYYVDTFSKDKSTYIVYNRKDIQNINPNFVCLVEGSNEEVALHGTLDNHEVYMDDNKYRTYRMAMACTIEYANYHINQAGIASSASLQTKKAAVLAAMNVTVTRLNSIYERDLASKLVLVNNNDLLIFVTSDNFSNDDAVTLISQSQTVITNIIGTNNYDIGHTVSTGGGGLAALGSLCDNYQKASGITGSAAPVGDPFDIDYVAHEVGHQFGADHTFRANTGSCYGNANTATAAEPGSGSTIMAYAGICGANDNVQNASDAYFHAVSLAQIRTVLLSTSCGTIVTANNPTPTINGGNNYTIPKGTPFVLTATATDSNNPNTLTYNWEQVDTQSSTQPPVSTATGGPSFRSIAPTSNPSRYFPAYTTVLSGTTNSNGVVGSKWEVLPMATRTLTFRATVRDNNAINGGQTKTTGNVTLTVADAGPFVITYPDNKTTTAGVEWWAGQTPTITWNVAGTTANNINTANVKISYSTDNGATYTTLIESTPNDGSEQITVPSLSTTTTQARIKIEAIGNVYYTVSKAIKINQVGASSEDFELENFEMYPNPTSDVTYISFDSEGECSLELFDLTGKKVYQNTIENTRNIKTSIDLSSFASGIYLLQINDGNRKMVRKIIKK